MAKIKFTIDSSADLPKEWIEKLDVSTIPIHVILGSDSHLDGDISMDEMYDYVAKTKQLPKTAARTADDYREFFESYTKEGYSVIHFGLSTGISLTTKSALTAAEQMENVFVVDTKALSSAVSLLIFYADELRTKGLEAKDIYEKCIERVPHIHCSFVIDSLEYLRKGGRCSALQYLGANLLKIKPTIRMEEGKMKMGKKYRGNLKNIAPSYVDNVFDEFPNPDLSRIFITHTELDREVYDSLYEAVKRRFPFNEIIEGFAGMTITSHCGKGTFGILFMTDGNH